MTTAESLLQSAEIRGVHRTNTAPRISPGPPKNQSAERAAELLTGSTAIRGAAGESGPGEAKSRSIRVRGRRSAGGSLL